MRIYLDFYYKTVFVLDKALEKKNMRFYMYTYIVVYMYNPIINLTYFDRLINLQI